MEIVTANNAIELVRLKIDETEIFLEELGENKGKIIIANPYGHNYSMYWGSMGGTLKEFIVSINSDYFSDKLLGHISREVFCAKGTFRNVRKFIREELCLPWYKHMEFQKDFREKLKQFEENCIEINSEQYFVDQFNYYFSTAPNFHLIEDRWQMQDVESDFSNISEPWHFIATKESDQTKWLKNLHKKLKKELKKP